MKTAVGSRAQSRSSVDAGLRAHMLRVYNLMMAGVALTGLVAWLIASLSVEGDELTEFGKTLFTGALGWVVMLAPIAIAFFVGARAHALSVGALTSVFAAYAAALGVLTGSVFIVYTGASIAKVFFITAASFGALSLWGYVTKRDLTGWGSFLLMGLFGLIIASLVNLFVASGPLHFVIHVFGVLIFAGYTAYDTQKIKDSYLGSSSGETTAKLAVLGAFELYTDFVGLFLHLTGLLGDRD